MSILSFIQNYKDSRTIKKMVRRIQEMPIGSWPYIYDQLNKWEFPSYFYDLIPMWWVRKTDGRRASNIVRPIMKIIKERLGEKELLRVHNVYVDEMTDKEFEYWYSIMNNSKALETYYKRQCKVEKLDWWKDDVYSKLVSCGVIDENDN